MKLLRLWTLLPAALILASPVARTYASSLNHQSAPLVRTNAHALPRSSLFVTPGIVNVGQRVTFSVVAPVPSVVRISFSSFHHSFTGTAFYGRSVRAYVESVYLLPRVHGIERAQLVATITPRATGRTYRLYGQFFIRGEAAPMMGIPQNNGGDGDADNNGAQSDGDGDR